MKNKINQNKIKSLGFLNYISFAVGVVLLFSWSVKASSFVVLQQELQEQTFKEITGVVKTEYGDPIPNVAVLLVGTNQGTETDFEGKYTITAKQGDKVQFVFEGFKTTTVIVSQSNILNITMVEEDTKLSDIENYYRTTTTTQAESVFSINSNLVDRGKPNLNLIRYVLPINTLQGQVISQNSKIAESNYKKPETNRKPETILKDVESLTRNGNYTYVVDGVRVSEETFRSLNQNDIESVDIYKHSDITRAMHGDKESQNRVELKVK